MKIGIIALGWLGKQLSKAFSEKGHQVVGSYFHEPKGFDGEFRYDFNQNRYPKALNDCDCLIFNLPPSKINSLEDFKLFLDNVNSRFLFVSSTSVYGQKGEVDESVRPEPRSANGKFLLQCEELVSRLDDHLVIRPGGLYGEDRHPAKFMSGRRISSGETERVNLISGESLCDVVMKALLVKGAPSIINAVNSNHPLKTEYYLQACAKLGLESPNFVLTKEEVKIVSTRYELFRVNSEL